MINLDNKYVKSFFIIVFVIVGLVLYINNSDKKEKIIDKPKTEDINNNADDEFYEFDTSINPNLDYSDIIDQNIEKQPMSYNSYQVIKASDALIANLYFNDFLMKWLYNRDLAENILENVVSNEFSLSFNSKYLKYKYNNNTKVLIVEDENYIYRFNISYVLNYSLSITPLEELDEINE